ncbi:MAG: hypothetical protein HKN76_07660 [Saprospiraceae bacterium]|nr:hypothetical protein [Saprospiraceae bacterium]
MAQTNGVLVNEGLERCRHFVEGWLAHADKKTGLIPRNLEDGSDIWNAKDAAADNYPFMVLTAALTDSLQFYGHMLQMLKTEEKLTSRVGHMPDTYQFSTGRFLSPEPDLQDIIFGSSEYIKDGLLPLTEWLGHSPWSDRMINILDDIWDKAPVETNFGNIPSENVEVNGEMLQVLSRIYWMTGDQKYLVWAIRLGDYYLLENRHPTHDFASLRLRDHGCEIVSGLCELYATVHYKNPDKKAQYRIRIHEMLDRILDTRNPDGLFYNVVNPQSGEPINDQVADNFGYNLNGFYTVYQLDSIFQYRDATIKALEVLNANYRSFAWEGTSADGYADAIEGTLNLYNREPVPSAAFWLDSEIKVMWQKQQPDGVIEGWHGDGNFARTTIMYCLWKSKGTYMKPWRSDLQIGATMSGDTLWVNILTESPWEGKIFFDTPRHATILNLPHDWPRINQFPEWYVAYENQTYEYRTNHGDSNVYSGAELAEGIPVRIDGTSPLRIKLH